MSVPTIVQTIAALQYYADGSKGSIEQAEANQADMSLSQEMRDLAMRHSIAFTSHWNAFTKAIQVLTEIASTGTYNTKPGD